MRFRSAASAKKRKTVFRQPKPSAVPALPEVDLAARYRQARVGGDYYEFAAIGRRLVFVLLDIAGDREHAMDTAAVVQEAFRSAVPKLFAGEMINESEAVSEVVLLLNRTILDTAGVRCSPGMVACYNLDLGVLTYVNAGAVPALVRDENGVAMLEAGSLPLGLFSHATHDALHSALGRGAALLVTSRGVTESKYLDYEFCLEKLTRSFAAAPAGSSAHQIAEHVLSWNERFARPGDQENDRTAVALVRTH